MTCDCLITKSVGKKFLMALTGFMMGGFILGHLLGNLTIFAGRELINVYAHHLEELKPLVWAARITLLTLLSIHIVMALCLTARNRKARPIGYAKQVSQYTTLSARTMALSGLVVLGFIIFHLLHFTFRVTHPDISNAIDSNGHRDVFKMVVLSFQQPLIALTYIASLTLLFWHLSHGFWSLLQSLGILNERTLEPARKFGFLAALVIYIGYISIPLSCFFGLVKV